MISSTSTTAYCYNNRAILLGDVFRVIHRFFIENGIEVTTASLVKKMMETRHYPRLSKIDILKLLISFGVRTIPCKLDLPAAMAYGQLSFMVIADPEPVYVYVQHITNLWVTYFHPGRGICNVPVDIFLQSWTGDAIVCQLPVQRYKEQGFNNVVAKEQDEMDTYNNEMVEINDVVSQQDCTKIIRICEENNLFNRSQVTNVERESSSHTIRTSYSAFIDDYSGEVFHELIQKAVELTGRPASNIEGLQCVRYGKGQQFKVHFDANVKELPRLFTILVYLNDDYEGGETYFPVLERIITPKTGKALIFRNLDEHMQPLIYSAHAGLPIHSGTKYALNIWIN